MLRLLLAAALLIQFDAVLASGTTLSLDLDDGIQLDATYFDGGEPGPGLLFLNMCDPSRDQNDWNSLASEMSQRGYHVLTFDYRGFGASGGTRPTHLRSIKEAMPYWRENWMSDVESAYRLLLAQDGVSSANIGIAGASCGVFLGLEFATTTDHVRSLVFLGGPTDHMQRQRLTELTDLPVLLVTGNQRGPNETQGTLEWSDDVFNASQNSESRIVKYKLLTYGTRLFDHKPEAEGMIVDWFLQTLPIE